MNTLLVQKGIDSPEGSGFSFVSSRKKTSTSDPSP